jgi:glycosyltransferase involved in cell wall biosynthesis
MPTRNGARWIREALESALAQSWEPLEVLVVDDASSDDTVRIVRGAGDARVRVVENRAARGLPGNWNRCVELARGAFVKFLFQDDLLHPRCVERMAGVLERHPSVGLVFSRREILLEDPGDPRALAWKRTFGTLHLGLGPLGERNPGLALAWRCVRGGLHVNRVGEPTAVMVRRACFERLGVFDGRLRQLVDWEMWLRVMVAYDIGFVDEALATFRVHAASATEENVRARRDRFDKLILWEGFLRRAGLALLSGAARPGSRLEAS